MSYTKLQEIFSTGKLVRMYKNRSTTKSWVLIFKVKSSNNVEKFVHISDCGRLFKLADFIFHIYKINVENSDFEFVYLINKEKSYGGYTIFKLGEDRKVEGVGNMRHARIDSAFF
jgi:hypothetical protein